MHSAIDIPHFALETPHFALDIPHSAFKKIAHVQDPLLCQ